MLLLNTINLSSSSASWYAFAMFRNIRTELRMLNAHQLLWQYGSKLIGALVARFSLRNNPADSSGSLYIDLW